MFLLDTNVLSELRRPERANPNVVQWADGVPVDQFFVSVMSLFEIERGALLMARKRYGSHGPAFCEAGSTTIFACASQTASCLSMKPSRCDAHACTSPIHDRNATP